MQSKSHLLHEGKNPTRYKYTLYTPSYFLYNVIENTIRTVLIYLSANRNKYIVKIGPTISWLIIVIDAACTFHIIHVAYPTRSLMSHHRNINDNTFACCYT